MAKAMSGVAIIDFEASCLPEDGSSYPIEVALAKVGGPSRTWLIKPAPKWRYWHWSAEAEQLHGITPAMLERDGLDPARVLVELTEAARGHDIYADCDIDAYWLETLADAVRRPLPFAVRYLGELLVARGVERAAVVEALGIAKQRMPMEHVARHDASRLALVVELLDRQASA